MYNNINWLDGDGFDLLSAFGVGRINPTNNERKVCPLCKANFAQIVQSGKIGCGECYVTFKAELEPTVIKMHGRAKHVGKIPKNLESKIGIKRKIEELNLKLRKLIETQNFEEAAVVRDEINSLSQQGV